MKHFFGENLYVENGKLGNIFLWKSFELNIGNNHLSANLMLLIF